MKNIRSKIMLCMTVTVMAVVLLLGTISVLTNFIGTNSLLRQTMSEVANVAADRVSQELNTYKQIAYEAGSIATLSSDTTSVKQKQTILDQRMESHGFIQAGIIDENGFDALNGSTENYSDQEYFIRAMRGETTVSEPTLNPKTGELIIIIAAPLWSNGIPGGKSVGAVYFVPDPAFLNSIVTSIHASPNGSAYMLDSHGVTIAHKNMETVLRRENTSEDAKTDPALADLAALEQKMVKGETGFGMYTYNGVSKLLAYAPIEGTDGWSIAFNSPVQDFSSSLTNGITVTVVMAIVALVVSIVVAFFFSDTISKPLKLCAQRLNDMSAGDLHSEVPSVRARDEIGALLGATAALREDFENIIGDIKFLMGEMSRGNFTVKTDHQNYYRGDYEEILLSMRGLHDNLEDTLGQINLAAEQVDSGSDQVANSAQALSQGTAEQAASVQELAATVNEISHHVAASGEYANEASTKTGDAGALMNQCTGQMQDLLSAMDDISKTSEEIGKIIKTIEDIAFQTNILALNAAVEAARAGAAGKGFAVVADEVRNLAAKSAAASKNTSALIEAAMAAVGRGVKLANGTADQLQAVSESAQTVMGMVAKIAVGAQEQTASIQQVSIGIDQISAVVQANSATAEESAAASEELSSQAQMLKDLIGHFQLESNSGADIPSRPNYGCSASNHEDYTQPRADFTADFSSSKY